MSNTAEIVLTAPATEMSTHHGKEFMGFGTCTPPGVVPSWFVKFFFYPKVKNKNGVVKFAPYGLRKVEAALIENGFNVVTVTHTIQKSTEKLLNSMDHDVTGVNDLKENYLAGFKNTLLKLGYLAFAWCLYMLLSRDFDIGIKDVRGSQTAGARGGLPISRRKSCTGRLE